MEKGYTVNIVQLNSFFSSANSKSNIFTIALGISMPNGIEKLAVATGKNIPEAISECIKKITGIKLIIKHYSFNPLETTVRVEFNKRIFKQTHFDCNLNPIKALTEALFDILPRLPRK